MRKITCSDCQTPYPQEDIAFIWTDGQQVFTDTCWRCFDKDTPVVRPKLAHDDLHSSWDSTRGIFGTHGKLRH